MQNQLALIFAKTGDVNANYTRCLFLKHFPLCVCVCGGGGVEVIGKTAEFKKNVSGPAAFICKGALIKKG